MYSIDPQDIDLGILGAEFVVESTGEGFRATKVVLTPEGQLRVVLVPEGHEETTASEPAGAAFVHSSLPADTPAAADHTRDQ